MTEIRDLYEQLKKLQENVRKLGPARRKEKLGQDKLAEAELLYSQYECCVEKYSDKVEKAEISLEDSQLIQTYIQKCEEVYAKIKGYFKETSHETIMASKIDFDLKTAVSLLPVMDGSETATEQLIDAIELYSTMIKDTDCQTLINFVLKTRLSHSAKLRLSQSYKEVKEMVDDMKKHLLTTKSDTALQKQLHTARQGSKSIEQFGQELEDLFVNLTISQANGNTNSYAVLKPLNEKQAIHKFADGLRNERLSTIVSARGYTSLKEAIQGAKDEEISMTASTSTSSGQIFHVHRGSHNKRYHKSPFRGSNRNYRVNNSAQAQNQNQSSPGRQYSRNYSRGGYRGRYQNYYRGRSSNSKMQNIRPHIHVVQESGRMNEPEQTINQQFFRD